jgi:Nucleotidyl transferase AbiEii toxin, Type IV TA system
VSSGDAVFRRIQSAARSTAAKTRSSAPTQEYLIRHTLESFLDRLTRTSHVGDFVLKGGILLAAYGVRRPTKDADSNAVNADVTAEHLAQVVIDIAAIDVDDGVAFDIDTISVQEIREQADYPALRVRVAASIGPWEAVAAWDVSTGDLIVPPPRQVTIDRILGDPITLLGYAPETTIAEKGVTILERGITSTRWRDYVDIVALARHGIDHDELLRSARAVTRHRGVILEPVAPHLVGYGAVAQAKWAAWRRKEHLESACEENLDDQITLVASYLDSVFARGPGIGRGDIAPSADG